MDTLTMGSVHLKAASVTDGIMGGYLEYMLVDRLANGYKSLIGARLSAKA